MNFKQTFIIFSLALSSLAFAQSSDELLQSYKNNPGDSSIYFQYGVALINEHKETEAISVFEKLLLTNPQSPSLYNNLAVLYANQQNFDKTEELLKNAIKVSPNYSTAYENLADLYAKLSSINYKKSYQLSGNNELLSKIDNLNHALDSKDSSINVNEIKSTVVAQNTSDNSLLNKSKPISPDTKVLTSNGLITLPTSLPNKDTLLPKTEIANTVIKSNDTDDINSFLEHWKKSWESKNLNQYISYYSSNYSTSKLSHDEWLSSKMKNMNNQKNIHIELYNIKIEHDNKDVFISFIQKYKSNKTYSKEFMKFTIQKYNNEWKFVKKIN